ncbi:glycoside hydrolase family 3 C-terminal domain-containing protein [Roseimarinus sediminis]|uniref:glycoside hydrolase family 3 C-terminal domain-containing protein n=1 Tax=Roseimarinus sediminis TaxID=1610899 RepID=UPI003D1A960A
MRCFFISIVLFLLSYPLAAQEHAFQNPEIPEEERIDQLISLLTLDEKINFLSTRPEVPRLGIRRHRIIEGLHGAALSGPANWAVKGQGEAPNTTFPQAYGLAQMWNPELLEQIAAHEAYECRYLTQSPKYLSGGLIVLAPNADIGRDVRWGRTEECYGEDAYLAGELTVAFVKGLQGDHPRYLKTASLMKHFLANSNENNRTINSSDFSERLFREYYSYPFYKGISEGGSRAYMAAYNKVNGIPATVHPMLKEITVNEWGQNGIIATDGGAFRLLVSAHKYYPNLEEAAVACIRSGITMFLDDYKEPLKKALEKGLLAESEIDQAIRGSLRVLLRLGWFDESDENPYAQIGIKDTIDPWTLPEAHQLARKATAQSVVLLKNEHNTLPLKTDLIDTIAVIGPVADLVVSDWYAGTPPYAVSALEGIRNAVGNDVTVLFAASNKADSATIAATKADAAIVCVGNHPLAYNLGWGVSYVPSDGKEDVDRQALTLEQEDLVKLVHQANPNTVMVLISSFPYAINWSKEHLPAIVHITQSSQELGNGLADVLFGKVSPAGRLVQSWPKSISDLLPMLEYDITKGSTYQYNTHPPLFPFGYGLSYTTFEYSNLHSSHQTVRDGDKVELTFQLSNTGSFGSDEVVQLYVRFPDSGVKRPRLALKAFQRIHVPAGQSKNVSLLLDTEDLKYWNSEAHSFVLEEGRIDFFIGGSSVDEQLKGKLKAK